MSLVAVLLLFGLSSLNKVRQSQLSPIESLGKAIFFDTEISVNQNMSCATCHSVASGGTAESDISNRKLGLHPGSKFISYEAEPSASNTFAFRNIQTNGYAVYSPPLHRELAEDGSVTMVGGNFWDGRAVGFITGRPTQEQALVPPLGTLEQELPASACVVRVVTRASNSKRYGVSYQSVFGSSIDSVDWPEGIDQACTLSDSVIDMKTAQDDITIQRAYSNISKALWAYQGSKEVVPFSSKFDSYLDGSATLTASESRGLDLFNGRAKCSACHVSTARPGLSKPLFTDFSYDNLGVPRNPANPVYRFAVINPDGDNWVDEGLGDVLRHDDTLREQANDNIGKFKVPTLRNTDQRPSADFVRSYMHNGYFRSLEQVVDFYNSRDTKPRCSDRFTDAETAERLGCWPEPEISANLNRSELGNLGLSAQEQTDLVSFLKTLSDQVGDQPESKQL